MLLSGIGAGSAAAEPASATDGDRSLTISESADIAVTDSVVTVSGTGFDPAVDVYLAICAADLVPADPLTFCLGGAVPDGNPGGAWAVVTSAPDGRANAATFTSGGSFSVDLNIDSAVGSSVDCLTEGCLLVARSAGAPEQRPADITIPLTFTEASQTSEAPSTVSPETVGLPEAQIGDQQTVVFAGFAAGEEVAVTVFSEPVELPPVLAGPSGIVTITFVVTEQMTPGQHSVQAIGRQSGTVGVANFVVLEPPPPSTSESVASSAPSTAESTSAVATSTETTSAETTTSEVVAPTQPAQGNPLWWLWAALAVIVLIGGLTLAVALSRRRAQQLEQERVAREEQLAAASGGVEPSGGVGPGPYASGGFVPPGAGAAAGDYPGSADHPAFRPGQERGLLSGHTGEGPALYSGQGGPTGAGQHYPTPGPRRLGPDPAEPPTDQIPTGDPGGPSTEVWSPGPAEDAGGPATQQWSPWSADEAAETEPESDRYRSDPDEPDSPDGPRQGRP